MKIDTESQRLPVPILRPTATQPARTVHVEIPPTPFAAGRNPFCPLRGSAQYDDGSSRSKITTDAALGRHIDVYA